MKEMIHSNNAPSAIGPYSQALMTKDLVFVSGQLPVNPEDGLVSETIEEQTAQSLKNINAILESVGLNLDSIVKTTVYMSDLNEFVAMNAVYNAFFTQPYPARACVEVARLPKDVKVEIEAIACR